MQKKKFQISVRDIRKLKSTELEIDEETKVRDVLEMMGIDDKDSAFLSYRFEKCDNEKNIKSYFENEDGCDAQFQLCTAMSLEEVPRI